MKTKYFLTRVEKSTAGFLLKNTLTRFAESLVTFSMRASHSKR